MSEIKKRMPLWLKGDRCLLIHPDGSIGPERGTVVRGGDLPLVFWDEAIDDGRGRRWERHIRAHHHTEHIYPLELK